jgi:hypothetical protein
LATNYVLIDLENVQPKNLELLKDHPFKIFVFVGMNQTKIMREVAIALQPLGHNGTYVQMSGNGKNALDFHIAYYIGELAAADAAADFHIISRDKGFDPLVLHLKGKNLQVQRHNDLAEIPVLRMASSSSHDDKIAAIVKNLKGRGQSKPRKVKTLKNTINNLFTKKLDESQLEGLVAELTKQKRIFVNDGNVSYALGK